MHNRRLNQIDAIYAKCIQLPPRDDQPTGCRIYQGRTNGDPIDPYGRVEVSGETVAPHVVIATCCHGFIPRGYHVDHKCNTRLCCEETHLQIVSVKRNQILKELRKQLKAELGYIPFEVKMNTLAKTTAKKSALKRKKTLKVKRKEAMQNAA